jgi:beta-lactamase regulating signal transducer with metallopeptidase domain
MEKISEAITIFLLNACWQIFFIWLASLSAARIMRKMPMRFQHNLWAFSLVLCFLIPLAGVFRSQILGFFVGSQIISSTVAKANSLTSGFSRFEQPLAFCLSRKYIFALVFISFISTGIITLIRKWRNTKRIYGNFTDEILPTAIGGIICQCREIFGVSKVRLVFSGETKIPATVGFLAPKIILPNASLQISDEKLLLTAIGHEMAHVRRRDYLFNLCFEILNIFVGFHPAVWFIKRKIAETREMAVDEMVTEKLLDKTAYSRSLLQLSSEFVSQNRIYSLGMNDGYILEKRINNLIFYKTEKSVWKTVLATLSAAQIFIIVVFISIGFSFNRHAPTMTDFISGRWKLFIKSAQDKSPTNDASANLFLQISDGELSGKAVVFNREQSKEFTLIEPTLDDTQFSFKIDNGEEILEGKLNREPEGFSGSWISTESNQYGSLQISR